MLLEQEPAKLSPPLLGIFWQLLSENLVSLEVGL
jgi:hypothetical protein